MPEPASQTERERRLLARVALAGTALVFVVVVTSAFLRLVRAGVGCEDWPQCYGAPLALATTAVAKTVPWMQVMHLLAAAGVGVLALAALAMALRKPRRRETAIVALLLGALTLFLAVLGRVTPGSQLPAVTLGNVLGGMTLLALFGWLRLDCTAPARASGGGGLAVAAGFGLALLAAQIALGTILSANFAARACAGIAECGVAAAEWNFAAFNPWRFPDAPAAADLARRTLHMAHRWSGAAVAVYFLGLAAVMWRTRGGTRRGIASALVALPVVQVGLGIALVRLDVPLAAAVAHSGASALFVLAATGALYYSRSAEAAAVSAACQTVTSK
jgi:cytochrome c oxidase assembly protein subunit 15